MVYVKYFNSNTFYASLFILSISFYSWDHLADATWRQRRRISPFFTSSIGKEQLCRWKVPKRSDFIPVATRLRPKPQRAARENSRFLVAKPMWSSPRTNSNPAGMSEREQRGSETDWWRRLTDSYPPFTGRLHVGFVGLLCCLFSLF